jgi:hypothetical protein
LVRLLTIIFSVTWRFKNGKEESKKEISQEEISQEEEMIP